MVDLLFYLLFGIAAGLVAGLFGIGGGVIIVPALVFAFSLQNLPSDLLTHMAVGTSLATIVVTSISSVRAHHQQGSVRWPIFWAMAPGLMIGVWVGVQTMLRLSGPAMQLAIGCFLLLVSIQMGTGVQPGTLADVPRRWVLFVLATLIGWLSAIFGIGGGSLTVPFLTACRVKVQQAVGTSAACGLPIALVGALSNMLATPLGEDVPQWATGNVYWPAFLGLAVTSMPFAQVGAKLAHRLPEHLLKRLFVIFLGLVGLSLILKSRGIF